jgi:cobalt-precorrin 5A hydrolase/precorrin-3B C17-methyltransferase
VGVNEAPAVVVLSPAALATARRIAAALPGAGIHGAARVAGADVAFLDVGEHLRALFAAGVPIVGVVASGILIRALAPLLGDKMSEPPVLAVAVDGGAVVPLLGGHRGANRLAMAIGNALGVPPALTTAGEVGLGVALDDPPFGWHVRNPEAAKDIAARLLAGEPVALRVEAGDAAWLAGMAFAARAEASILVTDRDRSGDERTLVLNPPVLALGVGCERDTDPAELVDLAVRVLGESGLARGAVACVASLDLKADELAVHELADGFGVPARFFGVAELEEETPRLANPSEQVFAAVGAHGVAEAAALRAAGPDSTLVVAKRTSARATVALARAARAIDAGRVGRARGSLAVVGLGPGGPDWRTPEAARALARATDLVGYRGYLDLVEGVTAARHPFALGEEEARAARALDLAAEGRDVALVSSGDPGIYAMASLVFESLERSGNPAWRRVAIAVIPGVSAMQMAAARAGAPLGHDFCAISLSDLLTPWSVIEARLRAAAAADFVLALYNPVSARRREGLARARAILLAHRPPETPVVLARNLGRDGESIAVTTLADLATESVDMLTTVVVGARATRRFELQGRPRVYTPRGYGECS